MMGVEQIRKMLAGCAVLGCLLGITVFAEQSDPRPMIPYEMVPCPQFSNGSDTPAAEVSTMEFAAPPVIDKIAVLVDSELYPEFTEDIANYEADVEAHFDADLLIYNTSNYRSMTFEQVRAELQSIWQIKKIKGAVMVGFFPIMEYQVHGQGLKEMGQIIGYEDLDGTFYDDGKYVLDGDNMVFVEGPADGIYDHHRWNDNGLDIWCAMIRPYQPGPEKWDTDYTPAVRDQLHNFFDRSHAYYNGQTVIPRRGLAYVNRDWAGSGYSMKTTLSQTYGSENTAAYYGGRNCGYWFMEERASGCEIAYLYSHSASWFHQFGRGMWHDVSNTDLNFKNGRGSVITYGFNCHGADFLETPTGCMGQHYVFDSELGQTYVGCMISTGVIGIEDQAKRLRDGQYLGQAFFEELNEQYQASQGFSSAVKQGTCWAQTILGNPFVTAAASRNFSAAPASISGTITGSRNVRLTLTKDGNIIAIERNLPTGPFTVSSLPAGDYTVIIETVPGDIVGYESVSLAPGQNLTGWDITLPNYNTHSGQWYYFHQTSGRTLPSGWNSAGADMNLWEGYSSNYGLVGYDEEVSVLGYGVGVNAFGDETGTVYVRRDFTVDDLGRQQRVWVYGLTQSGAAPQLWVNGSSVTMTTVDNRTDLSYWQYRGDITAYLNGGTNFMVASGYAHLHMRGPVYITDDLNDVQPPIPNPMTFLSRPVATGIKSVTMTATTALDTNFEVEYYFECVAGGGHDSGWQSDPVYTDVSLQPETYYAYRVKARDTSPNQNETDWSEVLPVTTYDTMSVGTDVYDGMNYGPNATDDSYGWSNTWYTASANGTVAVQPTGLSYPGLLTEGRCKKHTSTSESSDQIIRRDFQTPYSSGSFWLSALVRAEKVGSGHFFIYVDGNFEASIGKRWYGNFSINNTVPSPAQSMGAGQTYLLVARYDLRSGNDKITMWIDPPMDTGPTDENAYVTKDDRDLGAINWLAVRICGDTGGGGIYFVDEIRTGRTWGEVMPQVPYECPVLPGADFNGDCTVGVDDLALLGERWLTPSVFGPTDMVDFEAMAYNWLNSNRVSN